MLKLLEAAARGGGPARGYDAPAHAGTVTVERGPGGPHDLTDRERALIEQLRTEANSEKDIFGWHAFQAMSMSSIALGGILYLMFTPNGAVSVGLAAGAILVFALMTCQLGDSAYSSANRHYGYELFLYRIRTIDPDAAGRWLPEYRNIEWEAAMRAWRIVQTTLFEAVLRPGRYFRRDKYRRGFDPSQRPFWFCQASLSKDSGARPYAGSYLARMHLMLVLVAIACDILLLVTVFAVALRPAVSGDADLNAILTTACLVAFLFGTVALFARWRAEKARRAVMEDGLLSIHSCSIVWQAVVIAHFCALERARTCGMTSWDLTLLARKARQKHYKDWKKWRCGGLRFESIVERMHGKCDDQSKVDGAGLTGYTFWLGEEAASLARCAVDVPGWIGLGEDTLRARGIVK